MQTLTKIDGIYADGKQLPVDDIALETEQTARRIGDVAVIGVGSILNREGTTADSTGASLSHEKSFEEFRRETSAQKSSVIVSRDLKHGIFFKALNHPVSRSTLGIRCLCIGSTLCNFFWSCVIFAAYQFAMIDSVIAQITIALFVDASKILCSVLRSYLAAIFAVVLTLIGAIRIPLLWRAFTLFHRLIISSKVRICQDIAKAC